MRSFFRYVSHFPTFIFSSVLYAYTNISRYREICWTGLTNFNFNIIVTSYNTCKNICFLLTNTFICVTILLSGGKPMKSYSSREVIKMLKADGWYEVNVVGSHHQYKHPTKKGRTTVKHPDKDIPLPTLRRIEEQSGLKFN